MRKTQHNYPLCMKGLGERLREARMEASLSQADLAVWVGCNGQQLVSWWETENTYPSTEYIVRICEVLNISADYLLGLTDKKKSAPTVGAAEGTKENNSMKKLTQKRSVVKA